MMTDSRQIAEKIAYPAIKKTNKQENFNPPKSEECLKKRGIFIDS
jgi:hypothetical protein